MGVLNATQHQCEKHRFWHALGIIINVPKLMQTEGSEDKHSCAAGVEAGPLSLPLTMHEPVMSVNDREVLYYIMQRGMRTARQRRRSIDYIMWFLMIKGGHNERSKIDADGRFRG